MVHRRLARSYMQEAPVEGNKGGPIEKIDPPYRQKVRDEMLLTTTFSTSKTTSTTSRNTSESARSLRASQIVQNQSFERDILFDSEIIERSFCCCTRTPQKSPQKSASEARRKLFRSCAPACHRTVRLSPRHSHKSRYQSVAPYLYQVSCDYFNVTDMLSCLCVLGPIAVMNTATTLFLVGHSWYLFATMSLGTKPLYLQCA